MRYIKEETKMTARELRIMLTRVYDQDLTIRELRQLLFNFDDQDAELEPSELTRMTYNG